MSRNKRGFFIRADQALELFSGKCYFEATSIPVGARIAAVHFDVFRDGFVIVMLHDSFPVVSPGEQIKITWMPELTEVDDLDPRLERLSAENGLLSEIVKMRSEDEGKK